LLVVEDLHWIDGETQALLDSLVEAMGSARLYVLVSYRPEYQHEADRGPSYTELRLDVLPPEWAREFLDSLLGEDPSLAPLKQLLARRGSPFFLEETVRTLVDTHALQGECGRYRLTHPVPALHVPPSVETVLSARIDRLDPEDRRLLQTAAVIGKDVPLLLLETVADLEASALRAGLARLHATEFLHEDALSTRGSVSLQARAHARGGVQGIAAGAPARAPRADDRGFRSTVWRPPDRTAQRTRDPRGARGTVEQGRAVRPATGGEGLRTWGLPRSHHEL